MRRPIIVLGAVGVVLLLAAALWSLLASEQLVKYTMISTRPRSRAGR